MARMTLLDFQLHNRMEDMKCIGESRHQAKKEYKEMTGDKRGNRTVGIHSYNTYGSYKQTSKEFCRYLKVNHKDVKEISQVKESHIIDYLKFRQAEGKSAATVSKDMAALNKLLNCHITKKDGDLKKRSYKDITRSRGVKAHDSKYKPDNYKDQINFAKGTGARRESVLSVTPSAFTWLEGLPYKVRLKEKGGKVREATIRKDYQDRLKTMLDGKEDGKPLFDKYTSKIDNHAFRAEYAKAKYKEIAKELKDVKKDYRGYDSRVLKILTKDLGHNRLDVVVYNYLK